MKKIFFVLALIFLSSGFADSKHRFDVQVNIGVFYNPLARYGEWIESDWGHAWRPSHIQYGWRPYLMGRWIWTDYGWYWVSNEPFGWATYHYGRWNYDDYYGWIWIPDNEWGPAWVEWRYDDDYVGWAPLTPHALFNVSIGITFSSHWIAPVHYWNFISFRHFTSDRIDHYVQSTDRVRRIYDRSHEGHRIRGENERVINDGIDRNIVERRSDSRIRRVDIIDREQSRGDRLIREGNSEKIEAYRPRISRESPEIQTREQRSREGINSGLNRERFETRREDNSEKRDRILNNKTSRPERTPPTEESRRNFQSRSNNSERKLEPFKQNRENSREQMSAPKIDRQPDRREREYPRMDRQRPQNAERSVPQMRERSASEPKRDDSRSGGRRRP